MVTTEDNDESSDDEEQVDNSHFLFDKQTDKYQKLLQKVIDEGKSFVVKRHIDTPSAGDLSIRGIQIFIPYGAHYDAGDIITPHDGDMAVKYDDDNGYYYAITTDRGNVDLIGVNDVDIQN